MRIYIARITLLILLLAITIRLFYWQVIRADELAALAEGQRTVARKEGALRGDILSSDLFILASSKPTYLVFGQPKKLSDEEKAHVSLSLAKVFVKDKNDKKELESLRDEFKKKFSQNLYWVPLSKNVDQTKRKEIEDLNLPGLGFEEGSSRFYPEGSSSAHLLGFVASDSKGENTGYFGLEGFYNGELKGIAGDIRGEKDALGLPILTGQFKGKMAKNGKTLILNIDRAVQYIAENSLKKGIEKYGAKGAQAVVMNPKTGAILAMASFPNYDPSYFDDYPKEFYKNPVVAGSYEPGSTFKVLTMAAAINENVVTVETICDICSGPVSLGGFTIKTWNEKYYPNSSMRDVIVHSDNTGMVFVSKKLSLDKMYSYLENFGLGKPTGIDLQDETAPDLKPKDKWREIDVATTSFGQGIAVTPIQMIVAVGAIANNGNLMEPQVVKEIKNENGSFEIKPKVIRKVISETTAKVLTELMVAAVSEGEAKFAKPKGFRIAGKTGTAQIPVAGHYDPNKTIASFVGFAPASDPKFVILVRYDQPSSSIFGSETAAPTFFEITKELLTYYKIAPTEAE